MKKDLTFWITLGVVIIIVLILSFIGKSTFIKPPTEDEVKNSFEIIYVSSIWDVAHYEKGKVKIVPSITFKIKNIGKKPIQHVIVNGIFELEGFQVDLGDSWKPLFTKKPLMPGQISQSITLKSNYGYTASSRKAFYDNYDKWKRCWVTIYVKWNGSKYVKLKKFEIEKKIKGVKVIPIPSGTLKAE